MIKRTGSQGVGVLVEGDAHSYRAAQHRSRVASRWRRSRAGGEAGVAPGGLEARPSYTSSDIRLERLTSHEGKPKAALPCYWGGQRSGGNSSGAGMELEAGLWGHTVCRHLRFWQQECCFCGFSFLKLKSHDSISPLYSYFKIDHTSRSSSAVLSPLLWQWADLHLGFQMLRRKRFNR